MPHHCMELNNYLQHMYRKQPAVTWELKQDEPFHMCTWFAIVYIQGVEYGQGSGTTLQNAKEEAAHQALQALMKE